MDQTVAAAASGFGQKPRVWMQPTQYFMHSQWISLMSWLQYTDLQWLLEWVSANKWQNQAILTNSFL